jgi:hypothetical protein
MQKKMNWQSNGLCRNMSYSGAGKACFLMFLLVIVVTLQYETGAASELDTRISTHRITNATNLGLETASGGHIAPYGLLWTSRLPAWY